MAIFTEHAEYRRAGGFRPFRAAVAWLGLAMMLCLPGCGGCRKTPDAAEQEKREVEEKAKKKEKEKEPFEAGQPVAMPAGGGFSRSCKPGHWISQVWPDVKANRGDFQGELQTEIVDLPDRKVPLVGVPYEMTNQRPVALAKEQPKSLESFTWIPPRQEARSVNFKLAAGGGGPTAKDGFMGLDRMPSYRYFFVVLSQAAGRYEYLNKRLASIHLSRSNTEADAGPKYYEVVSMPGSRRPSLPSNSLYWTSIAYLLWDDFDPAQCDVDQQRALIDWLHWGGQIIVSGPDALEQLRNSFLRPYLPATVKKSRTFSVADLAELNYWDCATEVAHSPKPVKPWPGAVLEKDSHGEYVPYTGDLLIERQVGRGRVVASAFRLTGPELTAWKGFDCFFNACLLRRPARVFPRERVSGDTWLRWADGRAKSPRLDAAKMTALRYFARDTGVEFGSYAPDIAHAQKNAADSGSGDDDASLPPIEDDPNNSAQKIAPGLGAWKDSSPVAQAARTALVNAAGISVPQRSFIIWVVVGYLCVLVPANWIVFRLLGRVEWAWIAAPLIAIACTVVVIQQAQLNIGFARSRNEIAVIEMQAGYSRVHVARYTVLYTSLATRYEFRLADPGGQILPFPKDSLEKPNSLLGQDIGELVCRRGDDTQLTGFRVKSNAFDYVHSEEMADFGGTVTLYGDSGGGLRVTNGTKHPLDDCRAVLGPSGSADLAIGRLEPGGTATLKFERYDPQKAVADNRPQGANPTGELSAEEIAEVALDRQELRPGEICLVARIVDDVPGLTVTPVAQQTRQVALLVAHLTPGKLLEPEADRKEPPPSPQGRSSNPPAPTILPNVPVTKPESLRIDLDATTEDKDPNGR